MSSDHSYSVQYLPLKRRNSTFSSVNRYPDSGRGLMSFGAQLGQRAGPLASTGGDQDPLGHFRVGAGDPRGYGTQVVASHGGGMEVAAQVVRGFGGPECSVLYALLRHGERKCVGAADGGCRILASF